MASSNYVEQLQVWQRGTSGIIINRVLQTIFTGAILVSIAVIIFNVAAFPAYITLAIAIALESGRYGFRKGLLEDSQRERDSMYRFFFTGIRVVIVIFLIIAVWGTWAIYSESECTECSVFPAIGIAVTVLWSCVFLSYFIWAVYFYNVNLGLTEEEWDRIKEEKRKKAEGLFYNEQAIKEEPRHNPYRGETFGLPPGTVRGMIAFTLLFGAIAMLVVSVGLKNELRDGSVFHDHYEFFKDAFLMMIAFYFGSRAIEYLKEKNTGGSSSGKSRNKTEDTEDVDPNAKDPVADNAPPEIVAEEVEDPMQPKVEPRAEDQPKTDPVAPANQQVATEPAETKIDDPMARK